ncbi:MAG: hypothetical protein NC420_11375 [Eubacterium sp.]|nr:hypothetical protein [Eubacterium sp.]MCM1302667.1 hypothetical protein [Butyrivibrio sp.]MCM1342204.1 hypothetical protein [Muribaculaceae bacterium]MCM1409221.1 hypothetical protein [Lachnospiraceae bacterium]
MLKVVIFGCLFGGFYLLFYQGRILAWVSSILKKTQKDMDLAARQRGLENRKQLMELQEDHSLWFWLERMLYYCGIRQRFPALSVEIWVAGELTVAGVLFLVITVFAGIRAALLAIMAVMAAEAVLLRYLRSRNLRRVNDDLMKLLDFLGNYSITASEITGTLDQVSRYMEEPLKTALEQCYLEAQVTGDAGLALLSMADKVEHPKFQELARNMEISLRYCANLTALVNSSRRSLREHLRISLERKAMLREAVVNMALLLVMSLAVLMAVGHLINLSLRDLVWGTVPGRIGLAALGVIFLLFWMQLQRVHR